MDEIISYLQTPMAKYIFGLVVFVVVILATIVRGIISNRFRSLDESKSIGTNIHSKEPMSPSETIGDISMRLGDDVREVRGKGYSDSQINDVLTGKYTLDDLYKMKPQGNNHD